MPPQGRVAPARQHEVSAHLFRRLDERPDDLTVHLYRPALRKAARVRQHEEGRSRLREPPAHLLHRPVSQHRNIVHALHARGIVVQNPDLAAPRCHAPTYLRQKRPLRQTRRLPPEVRRSVYRLDARVHLWCHTLPPGSHPTRIVMQPASPRRRPEDESHPGHPRQQVTGHLTPYLPVILLVSRLSNNGETGGKHGKRQRDYRA